jgi:hypothetical protein
MIEYLGTIMEAIDNQGHEIAQFSIGFLNTTKNALFKVKSYASPAAIENPNFRRETLFLPKSE